MYITCIKHIKIVMYNVPSVKVYAILLFHNIYIELFIIIFFLVYMF